MWFQTTILLTVLFFIWLGINYIYLKQIVAITSRNNSPNQYNSQLKQFETELNQWYPLNDTDSFRIDHGANYCKFFERMGKHYINLAVDDHKKIIATGSGVLRKISLNINDRSKSKVWYICDLKVAPHFRNQWIPFKMLLKSVYRIYETRKIYGISMGSAEKVIKLSQKIPCFNFKPSGRLLIYSLDSEKMTTVCPILTKHRGLISFQSLTGIKDLILKSTNQVYPILHVCWGNKFESNQHFLPINGYQHMFCCPDNDPMKHELQQIGIETETYATIISMNMDNCDWKFILTSDI